MSDEVTVVARIRAVRGRGDALAALLAEQSEAVRKAEPGCVTYLPHRSTTDPELFLFYEVYRDDAAFAVHRDAPHLAQFRARREREGLVDGAVEVQVFRALKR